MLYMRMSRLTTFTCIYVYALQTGKDGLPALQVAASKSFAEVVKFLAERGANLEGRDDHQLTALHR